MVANGFEGVAWMTGGGAKHSANLGRVLAYAATSGNEGVVSPGDCKVSPSGTANNEVHVATGAVAIRNRYGATSSETYIARAPQVSDLTVGSTGSSARSDLVVVRMKDPQYGAQAPASVADGPYVFPEIIPGVPAGTTSAKQVASLSNQPVYALARIDIPANTTAITGGMIKELRELINPQWSIDTFMTVPTPGDALNGATAEGGRLWPSYQPTVKVPEWATHGYVVTTLSSVAQVGGPAYGLFTAVLGGLRADNIVFDLDDPTMNEARHTLTVGGGWDVRGLAGQSVQLRLEGRKLNPDSDPGYLITRPGTQVIFDVRFYQRVV